MAADIKDAGPLVSVVRYSIPWHGWVYNNELNTGKNDIDGNEVIIPWVQSPFWAADHFLVRKPGMPDPYEGEEGALRRAADALEGKEHTTYGIVQGQGVYGSKYVGVLGGAGGWRAWLWVDELGGVWSITYRGGVNNASYALVNSLSFRVRKFGDLRVVEYEPAEEFTLSGVLDLGQDLALAGGSAGIFTLEDVAVNGGKALFAITSESGTIRKTGFIEATFTMNEETGASLDLVLLANRAAALGSYTDVATRVVITTGAPTNYQEIETTRDITITDRMIGYTYDADGVAVPVMFSATFSTLETHLSDETDYPVEFWEAGVYNTGTTAQITIGELVLNYATEPFTVSFQRTDGATFFYDEPTGTTTVDYGALDTDKSEAYFIGPVGNLPHRINNKLYRMFSGGVETSTTYGVVWYGGLDQTIYDGDKTASLNPATEELYYPQDVGITFA